MRYILLASIRLLPVVQQGGDDDTTFGYAEFGYQRLQIALDPYTYYFSYLAFVSKVSRLIVSSMQIDSRYYTTLSLDWWG
jgi:hypothetical protein